MTGKNGIDSRLLRELKALEAEMIHYNRLLYDHPELPRQEYNSARELCAWLERHRFTVSPEVAGLPTAFVATYECGRAGAEVAFLAEYDALPVVGHGCGHNIIASSAVGAALALARMLESSAIPGRITVYGCPDEEYDGGKVPMVEAGLFPSTLDAVLHIHPGLSNSLWGWTPSATSLVMGFHGKAAHTAFEPEEGINALHALLVTFRALDALRHHVKDGTRMPATITDGGGAPNAVPAFAECRIHLTAGEKDYLLQLTEKVKNCGRGGALATGAEVDIWQGPFYDHMVNNVVIATCMKEAFAKTGRDIVPLERFTGSTDVGNVSMVVPTCAATIAVADPATQMHSKEFALATVSPRGERALNEAAAIMAQTALEIIGGAELRDRIRASFLNGACN